MELIYNPDDEIVPEKIVLAKEGNSEAARWLLERFRNSVRESLNKKGALLKKPHGQIENVSPEIAIYLCNCFDSYLSGEKTIDKALNIASSKGRPPSSKIKARNIEIATAVMELMVFQDMTLEDAAAGVAGQFSKHESKIQDIYRQFKSEALASLVDRQLDTHH